MRALARALAVPYAMTDNRSCEEGVYIGEAKKGGRGEKREKRGVERRERRKRREERVREEVMYIYKVVCRYTHACYKRERERERQRQTDRELTVQVLSLIFISTVISNMWCLN